MAMAARKPGVLTDKIQMSPTDKNRTQTNMAITLSQIPLAANAKLEPADVAGITAALTPLVSLPNGENWTNVVALNLNIQPDGSGILNVRFAK